MKARSTYGIGVFHNIGDVLCCTPIAKQLKVDDPTCHVTYYTSQAGEVAIRNNPFIDEIVVLPGDPIELDREIPGLAAIKPWTRFFTPAAYLNYEAIPGGSIYQPKGTIFGIVKAGARLNWTIPFSAFPFRLLPEERAEARAFWARLPAGIKILVETDYRSEQSPWTDEWNFDMLDALRDLEPVFVFTSRRRPPFLDAFIARYPQAVWCDLGFRLNAELFNLCDAFVGVSSGLSCLTYSDYCRTDVPRIEVTRGEHWGAAELEHHQELALCYTRGKYNEALRALRCKLLALPTEPIFSPRFSPDARLEGSCPSCGIRGAAAPRSQEVHQCRACGAAYSISRNLKPAENLRVELVGGRVRSETAGEFLSADIEPDTYDAAYILGELGSILSPRELIEKVQYALRPGGKIHVSAPNIDGVAASCGPNWSEMKPEANLWYFTPLHLREILIQAGFVVDTWTTDTNGKNREPLLAALAKAKPELKGDELTGFAAEVDRRGGGDIIRVNAVKRGGYKGRVHALQAPLAKRPDPALSLHIAEGPLVSVIIPCFNHYRTLTEAVRSVLAQTYQNWELFLVNDGSTDGSGELAENLATEYRASRVRAVHIEHSGLEEARDIGAALAAGEWVLPLDSDDRLLPHFIETLLEASSKTPGSEIAYGRQEQFGLARRIWDPGAFDEQAVLAGRAMPSTALWKRTFWLEAGGFNTGSPLHLSEHHLWLAAIERKKSTAYVPNVLAEYRVESAGQIHHRTNARFLLARAFIRTLHPNLFSDEAIEAEHALIGEAGAELVDEINARVKRYPGLWGPYFWRGLIAEQNGLFDQANSDYDAAQLRQRQL